MSGWIIIRNWNKYQHYGNRRVPWIKLYTELLYDDDFMSLTPTERSALVGLWMLYAETRQRIPEDTSKVSRALGQRFTKTTLVSLNHAGFIDVSSRQPSRLEVEEEKEKDPPNPPQLQLPPGPPVEAPPRKASESRPAAAAYKPFVDEPEGEYLDPNVVSDLFLELVTTLSSNGQSSAE